MSELRLNIISKDWVIIASERAARPEDFKKAKQVEVVLPYQSHCPFCPGNEDAFPNNETSRIEKDGAWLVKSIYNKYPALSPEKELVRTFDGLEDLIQGYGVHEVVIEHPRHDLTIALMPDEDVSNILKVYAARYRVLMNMKGVEAVTIFKNQGLVAGASQKHPHSQIVATPIVPPQTRIRLDNAMRYFDATGKCIFCQMLANELKGKKRLVCETEKFVSFVPFAAAAPFIIWIFPKRHAPSFADIDSEELADMVKILKDALSRLYRGLDNPDFNYTIRSVPVNESGGKYFHWYLAIVPRISQPAGFELGSGIFINSTIPEDCADFLRQAR